MLVRNPFIVASIFLTQVAVAQFAGVERVESIMSEAVKVAGPAELMLTKNGEIFYNGNFGEPDSNAGKIRISSSSKWLASATILTLVDDGLITLDDEVGSFIRQFRNEKSVITLRQLLSHTSGLPANSVFIMDSTITLARSVNKTIRSASLIAPPGTQFIYGNISFQVAGRLAEVVSGKDWETLFKEKIANPCEMNSTDFGSGRHENIAEGAYSTATDFANFLTMILNKGTFNGKRVLSEKMVDEMLTDQISELDVGYTPYHFKSVKLSDYYGLGVWINRISIGDSTATEVSSRGANGFTPWINLCKQFGGVFSFDSDLSLVDPVIQEAKPIIDASFGDDCADMQPAARPFSKIEDLMDAPHIVNVLVRLEEEAMVSLKLFDLLGNELQVLINGKTKAGSYLVPINTTFLTPGVYFYRLVINDEVETKKIRVRK